MRQGEPIVAKAAPARDGGVILLLALLTLLLVLALGAIAVLAARRVPTTGLEAADRIARRAAEAGVAAAVDWLAAACAAQGDLSVALAAAPPDGRPSVVGSGAAPGDARAVLDPALGSSYTVWVHAASDHDGDDAARVRALGTGPRGASVVVEALVVAEPCPALRIAGWREGP